MEYDSCVVTVGVDAIQEGQGIEGSGF